MHEPLGIGRSPGEPVWLALEPDPVLAFAHLPTEAAARATGVLICPPFGWNEMCSYRPRRVWADALAQAGYPAARIDLPGTGDSGGSPRDPGRLEAWTATISASADWLRELTGCARIAAIGIGLGGMLAWRAIAGGARIDDLLLWGVPDTGQRLLRELRAEASMLAGFYTENSRGSPSLPGGDADLAGYLLSAETASALERLELTPWPRPGAGRRVLLLMRGRSGADRRLRALLERTGATVTVAEVPGYEELIAPPLEARPPVRAISETLAWLSSSTTDGTVPSRRPAFVAAPGVERRSIDLFTDGGTIHETPLQLEIGSGSLMGVLSEPSPERPAAGLCAVLLPAGPMRHIGPSRIWVEVARQWAARGVPTLRVDLEGIGDADGDHRRYDDNAGLYVPELIEQTIAVLDELEARRLPGRFALVGMCSGAHWALHAALAGERVAAAVLINLYPVFWSEAVHAEYDARHVLGALRGAAWRRLLRGDFDRRHLQRLLDSMRPNRFLAGVGRRSELAQREAVDRVLDQLREQGTQTLIVLGNGEPLYDQFVRQGQIERLHHWPNVTLERLASDDHTCRPMSVQRELHAHIDAALERALAAAGPSPLQLQQPQ